MKFFIPFAESGEQSENVYKLIKEYISSTHGRYTTDERVFSVRFYHNGIEYIETVGDTSSLNGEPIIAIFIGKNGLCYICTENSGVRFGEPMQFRPSSYDLFS